MISAFWNANMQGLRKLMEEHRRHPVRTVTRAMLGITLPSIGLWFINKDDERIQRLPQWQRDLFWCINLARITGNPDSSIITIPKPFELGMIYGSLPERILDYVYRDDPQAIEDLAKNIGTGILPIPFPTIALPFVETKANYSFFMNRPIIPRALQQVEPQYQSYEWTPEFIKEIGALTKQSPLIIDNYLYGWTGGLGRTATYLMDKLLQKKEIVKEKKTALPTTLADIPGLRGFVAREPIGIGSDPVNDLFDLYNKVSIIQNTYKLIEKEGNSQKIKEYALAHKQELAIVKNLQPYMFQFGDLLGKRRQILTANWTPEIKARMIRDLDTDITVLAEGLLRKIKERRGE